jgi:hypothetical protein
MLVLRTLGNLVTGDDDMQTQYVLNLSVLRVLPSLLDSPKKEIRTEACWMLSNITAGNTSQIQAVIEAGVVPQLVALLNNTAEDDDCEVALQAAWAISNAAASGTPEQIRYLVEDAGCLRPLCALLGLSASCAEDAIAKAVAVVLKALDNILRVTGGQYAMHMDELRVSRSCSSRHTWTATSAKRPYAC